MTRNDSSPAREIQLPDQRAAILARADVAQQITTDWFDPDFWENQARPVSTGGRGGAWFVHHAGEDWVLRHYRRGGLPAKLSRRSYLYSSQRQARSFAEFQLLMALQVRGLPVPEPVAALCQRRSSWLYRAAILIRRIPGAVPLPASPRYREEALWAQVGATIRRFHDAGLDHVDLNVDNILVSGERVYLIDFDRCRLRQKSGGGWQANNIRRLRRSVEKRCRDLSEEDRRGLWQALTEAYAPDCS
ncbi:MAG: 3-deoxy-D-manno-octulosonic acid kinase [Pseudomonadales bacterium]|nr:3-deoxy-D-manno-octulosonic acid kinase [Pseudomonadales bacterium]